MTIARWIARHAQFQPGKTALRFDGHNWTYAQLHQAIIATAQALRSGLGLQRGERIAYYGLNSARQIILLFAAAREGLVLVPLNWRLAAPEIAFILSDCKISALFVDDEFSHALPLIAPDIAPHRIVGVGRQHAKLRSFEAFLATGDAAGAGDEAARGRLDDPLTIVYTSGTTGRPKGAVLTQKALTVGALNSIHMHDMTGRDHCLAILPMFHVGGVSILTLPALLCGGTVTVHARFDPQTAFDEIEKSRPNLMVIVPAIARALMAHPRWPEADISSLRMATTGSTDVPVDLIRAFAARDVPLIQCYGATETGPTAVYLRADQAIARIGSIGLPGLHCDVRIVNTNGTVVAAGEVGEIQIRSDALLAEYWSRPDATAEALVDGWFRTGDMARQDADGYLWFADRIKHVIISGGENIYPAELERLLNGMDEVGEAVVVGRDDEQWGEVPVAVVVRTTASLDRQTVLEAFEGKLARFKLPKDVVFVEALPRNAMGKVVVDDVKRMIGADQTGDG